MFNTLLLALPLLAAPQDDKPVVAAPVQDSVEAAIIKDQLPSYPLTTCAVSGKPLGSMGDPIDLVVEGRLVRLCCAGCTKRVEKDPASHIAKVDAAVVAEQGPSYPLAKCVISGEPLGSMGDPIDMVVGTRLVRVCCKSCTKKVTQDPAAALAPIDAALIAAQRPDYPLLVCLISGEELGSMGEPVELLYGTRLVRLCCKGCRKAFHKDPATPMATLAAATKARAEKAKRKDDEGSR